MKARPLFAVPAWLLGLCFSTVVAAAPGSQTVAAVDQKSARALPSAGAEAARADAPLDTSHLPDSMTQPLQMLLDRETAGIQARVEIRIGQLDSRLKLASCQNIEAFVPSGARLWGRSHIGLRCAEGARWQVYLPVEVKAYGQALHLIRPIAAGMPVSADDVRAEEVELTKLGVGVLTSVEQLSGRVATRPLLSSQPLLAQHLRGASILAAGDPVRVMIHSPSFTVTADGTAIASAAEGQPVRVRIASGRVITGTARKDGTVEVRL